MTNINHPYVDSIFQLSFGYWKSCILFTATEFDIFTLISKGTVTAKDISQSIHADERATEMLLNALVSLKLLTKQKNHYKNSPVSNLHLIKGKPLYLGDAVHHAHNIMDNWTMIRETIETGNAVSLKDLPEEVDPHDARV